MSNDNNHCLFSQEEMERMEPNSLFNPDNQHKPLICLGMTFDSEDARREYFREELRKKLPELKQIEGFPIGEDDDIINLSDPPYYTACPNPWLNDFIEQWEKEKVVLEKEGKRITDFEVNKPYASDVSEGKRNPIYDCHSYHTKVPHPAIMRYIMHYTQPGDTILDGFCGTGMTGVAASMCEHPENNIKTIIEKEFKLLNEPIKWGKRNAILSDLSPVATLISANYNSPETQDNVIKKISEKISSYEQKFKWMYTTNHQQGIVGTINYTVWSDVFICPNCGQEYVFYHVAVNSDTNEIYTDYPCPHCSSLISKKKSQKSMESYYDSLLNKVCQIQKKEPVLINYSIGKSTYTKVPDDNDLNTIKQVLESLNSIKLLSDRMIEGSESRRNDKQGITHVHQFYFPRTLIIFNELFKIADSKEFLFLLNSQLINVSKLNRYRPGKSFPYNPLSGTLYIGSQVSEANVFTALKNKCKKMSVAFSLLNANNITGVVSATNFNIKNNSIDYIFTDPPFGSNFFYSELNFIQEYWIKVKTNNKEEAIECSSQKKTVFDYQSIMTNCLREYYRVLKPNKWITIEFSNTSAAVWNSIQQAIKNAGFIIASVAALDKQQGSFKAIMTTTAVKQDLVITCYKPSDELLMTIDKSTNLGNSAMDFVEQLLIHLPVHIEKNKSTAAIIERSPKILYDRLISYYIQHDYPIPMDAHEFQKELRDRYIERDGMFFTVTQAVEYEEKKKTAPEFVSLGIIISDEASGIQWLKNQLRNKPMAYNEFSNEWMQATNGLRKNDILPELKQILEENFIEMEGGKWRLPNIQDDVDKEALRTKSLLREFKKYVEAASKPKAKIKEARVEALRAGFKQCYIEKDFKTIVLVGDKIPQNLRDEDETLLQFYDIAVNKM